MPGGEAVRLIVIRNLAGAHDSMLKEGSQVTPPPLLTLFVLVWEMRMS